MEVTLKNISKNSRVSPTITFVCGFLLIALALLLKLENVAIVMFLALFVSISPQFLKSLLKILNVSKKELSCLIRNFESEQDSNDNSFVQNEDEI